jgi:kynureninase
VGHEQAFDLSRFRAAYGAFLREGRVLLTGHSHQAWPDVAREAMTRWFDVSAELVDDKWSGSVMPTMARVGRRILERLGFAGDDAIAFGKSTHELAFRLLSCLPANARIVTTTGEFHSLDRQLMRLAEAGARVVWVSAEPREDLAERLVAAIGDAADLVAVSAVLFEDATVVQGLDRVIAQAERAGAVALVDAYHAFNVVPLGVTPAWDRAFVVAGGYKYAQFGEGVCFLRIPPDCELRPVYTGWFASFEELEGPRGNRDGLAFAKIGYAPGGARFAGATFDPAGIYRAEAVLDHFDRFGLGVDELRAISLRQTARIIGALRDAGVAVDSPLRDESRGGFVAVRVADAGDVVGRLRRVGVYTDARGERLRLGPAPYLTDDELDAGVRSVIAEIRP